MEHAPNQAPPAHRRRQQRRTRRRITSVAPGRGVDCASKAAQQSSGEPVGPTLLFFGCDHPDVDFLYRDELEELYDDNLLDVHAAFSEKPDGDIRFVQHRLWAERERISELFGTDAHFYVCGDGQQMAPAVR